MRIEKKSKQIPHQHHNLPRNQPQPITLQHQITDPSQPNNPKPHRPQSKLPCPHSPPLSSFILLSSPSLCFSILLHYHLHLHLLLHFNLNSEPKWRHWRHPQPLLPSASLRCSETLLTSVALQGLLLRLHQPLQPSRLLLCSPRRRLLRRPSPNLPPSPRLMMSSPSGTVRTHFSRLLLLFHGVSKFNLSWSGCRA